MKMSVDAHKVRSIVDIIDNFFGCVSDPHAEKKVVANIKPVSHFPIWMKIFMHELLLGAP
jgi:hypothetical protein